MTWRSTSGHPRGGGSHPMVAWGPGPTRGSARLWYTAMGGDPNNFHFGVSYSDNEGTTWHLVYIADNTRGWFGGMEDITVDTNPASPNFGAIYLAYNWPKDPIRGDGLRVIASRNYGRTWSETEVPKVSPPSGYGDAWRIGYKLTTAPDGSAYVAGYQLDMKHWSITCPFCKGGTSNVGRIAFGVSRLLLDRATGRLTHSANVLATRLPETSWNLGYTSWLKGVNVGLAEPCWATGLVVDAKGRHLLRRRGRRPNPDRLQRRSRPDVRIRGTCPTRRGRTAGRSSRCARSSSSAKGSSPCCSTRSMRRGATGPRAMRSP